VKNFKETWWPGTESNRRRQPFQGCVRFIKGLRAPRAALAQCGARFALTPERSRFWDFWNMVARDGIEPPTPAFSGLRSTN
jgi:hypothetical protein